MTTPLDLYDEDSGLYVVPISTRATPVRLTPREVAAIIQAWTVERVSQSELSRRVRLRKDSTGALLRALKITRTNHPWTEQDLRDRSEPDLIALKIEATEQRVLDQAQAKITRRTQRDADAYRKFDVAAQRLAEHLHDTSTDYEPPPLVLPVDTDPAAPPPYALIISPTDYHWGSYAPAHGGSPYDRDIARARLFSTTAELLCRAIRRGRPEQIIIAIGGDGLHIDNASSTTTRGTPQACDGTPEELAATWVELCRDYVDLVRQLAPVRLHVMPGNHDRYTAVLLRAAMQGWYHRSQHVEVVDSLSPRQYTTYGSSLVCFMHGDIGKPATWPLIVATEKPKAWGGAQHRYIFTGHLHTERQLPSHGDVTIYRLPSLAGTDRWHDEKGYTSRPAIQSFAVGKSSGIETIEIARD